MEWLIYLLKVSACTVLFFGFYVLVLRKLTFFKINRFYLIISLMLSFMIPALQFNIERKIASIPAVNLQKELIGPSQEVVQSNSIIQTMPNEVDAINWFAWIEGIYTFVAAAWLVLCTWQLFQLFKHTRKYTHQINGLKLIFKKSGFTNCSFFNYVFINQDDLTDNELQVMIKHEQVHASQYHSADKLFMMICKSILWFNPVVYLYNKTLEQTHEYEADQLTSLSFGNKDYAGLLLKLAVVKSNMPLVHNFVKSPIKERIKMLFQSKSKNMKKLMYLLVLPLGLGLMWLFSVQIIYAQIKSPAKIKTAVSDGPNRKSISGEQTDIEKSVINSAKPKYRATKQKVLMVNVDTTKAFEMPKILSYKKLTGNAKRKLSNFEGVEMEIYGGKLQAAYAEVDTENGLINAKNVVFVNRNGNAVSSTTMVFELKKGTYYTVAELKLPQSIPPELKQESILDKFQYKANDSIRMSKDKTIITLYGKAKISYKDFDITADEITYNTKTLSGSAKNPVMVNRKTQTTISGTRLKFDLKGKTEVWQD